MRWILGILVAALVIGGEATAQQACKTVRLEPGSTSTVLRGVAPAEGGLCFALDAEAGRRASLRVIKGRNVIFSIAGITDAQDKYAFTTQKQRYEISVGQLTRSVTDETFEIALKLDGGSGTTASQKADGGISDPEAFIKRIYASLAVPSGAGRFNQEFILAKANRSDFFTPKLVALLDADDRMSARNGGIGCIDFNLFVSGNDSDDAEVRRTLRVKATAAPGDTSIVEARYTNFKRPSLFRFTFERDGSRWKISDIQSGDSWRLSTFRCR